MKKYRINAVKTISYTFEVEAVDEHEANQIADNITEEECIEKCGDGNIHFEAEVEEL